MRRVLFVSYYAPPRTGVATIRTRQLMKYLPEHGWDVTVLTAALPGAASEIVQTPYLDLTTTLKRAVGIGEKSAHESLGTTPAARGTRRTFRQSLIAWGYRFTSYPDAQVGWFFTGRAALGTELARGQYDAVLSSAPPFTTHALIASSLGRVPWIADYRDLWGGSDAYASPVRRWFDRFFDRWFLRKAAAASTVSAPMATVIRSLRPELDVEVVPNAYDDDEWTNLPFETESATTFLYAGQLFGGRRDPRPLFRAIRALLDRGEIIGSEVRVVLYSAMEPWLGEAIAQSDVGELVHVKGVVSRDEVMRAERRADRLLVLLWEGANSEGILTGKLFEYFGARRRVLAIGGPERSAIDEVLAQADAGIRVRDAADTEREVLQAVIEHRRNDVRRTDSVKLAPFAASEMARRMASVLDRAMRVSSAAPVSEPAIAERYSP